LDIIHWSAAVITYYLHYQDEVEAYLAERRRQIGEAEREIAARFPTAGVRERLTNKTWYNGRVIKHRSQGDITMYAVEFQTKVKDDGSIDIPAAGRPQVHGTVRVIILTGASPAKPSIIRGLLNNPRRVANFTPFKRDEPLRCVLSRNLCQSLY
jgi:hypothetical protein